MSSRAGQREVIAHYPTKRLLIMAVGWPAVIAFVLYLTADVYHDMRPDRGLNLFYCAMAWAMVLFCLPRIVRLVVVSIVAGGAALWIENGRLVGADGLDVPLADVVSIGMVSSFSSYRRIPIYSESIFIRLASGREKKIWAEFVENEGEVVAILQERLGLKVVGDMRSWH